MDEGIAISDLFDLSHTIAAELLEKYTYSYEALKEIKDHILKLGTTLPESEYDKIGDDIWVSKSATIAPSATLHGPLIIGARTEVRPSAYIRGSVIVGEGCVVGNSTELKNCILFDGVQVPHFNYVGDSILGYKAHMGAGSIISNVRADKAPVPIRNSKGELVVATGLKKFGAALGDFAEIGCNAVINPGSIVGRHSSVYPTSCMRGILRENCIYTNDGRIIERTER